MWSLVLSLGSKLLPLLAGPVSQFVTGININQVLSNVVSAFTAIVEFVTKHWRLCLIVLLASGNIIGFTGWQHANQALKTELAAHKADIKTYKDAQTKANADAKQQEQSIIQESKVKANAADNAYHDLLAKYNANLVHYRTNQSGAVAASGDQASNQESSTPQSSDGPGGGSGLSISLSDAQKCATNTARLQAAHDWAIHLGDQTDDNN